MLELDELGEPRNGPMQQHLKTISKVTTVPQVFLNGKFIGGDEEIRALAASGGLAQALAAAIKS